MLKNRAVRGDLCSSTHSIKSEANVSVVQSLNWAYLNLPFMVVSNQRVHANVNARLAWLIIWVRAHEPGIEQHVVGQFNNIRQPDLYPACLI